MADAKNWAEANRFKLFLDESSSGTDAASLTTLNTTLAYMQQHNNVWQGGMA